MKRRLPHLILTVIFLAVIVPNLALADPPPKMEQISCPNDANHIQADVSNGTVVRLPVGTRMEAYGFSYHELGKTTTVRLCVTIAKLGKGDYAESHKETRVLKDGSRLSFTIVEHDLERRRYHGPASP